MNCFVLSGVEKTIVVGNETIKDFKQDAKLGFVVKAIYAMAYALHNMHRDVCGGKPGLCPAMDPIEGLRYLDYLMNVSFTSYSEENVHFDQNGDPPGR